MSRWCEMEPMHNWVITRTVVFVAALAGVAPMPAGTSSQSSIAKPKTTSAAKAKDTVHQITLPQLSLPIPEAVNMNVFMKDCLICHSVSYVTMQPRFSRSVWENEVKKMVTAYGAVIPDADRDKIVDYLMAVRGAEEQNSAAGTQTSSSPKRR